jgi:hypothetical protein
MNKTQTEKVRSEFIADLEAVAWRKQCNAEFMRDRTEAMNKDRMNIINHAKGTDIEADAAEANATNEQDHTRETREKIKAMRMDAAAKREQARQISRQIAEILNEAAVMEAEAKERLCLAEFAKTYGVERKLETDAKQDKKQ